MLEEEGRGNKIKIIHLAPFLLFSLFDEGHWKRQMKQIIFSNFKESHTLQIKKRKTRLPFGEHS